MKKLTVIAFIFLTIITFSGCSKSNAKEDTWQGSYYAYGKQENEMYGPVFNNYAACKSWALSKISNTDDLILCSKNCHDTMADGTPICEEVVRNKELLIGSKTFDNYKE